MLWPSQPRLHEIHTGEQNTQNLCRSKIKSITENKAQNKEKITAINDTPMPIKQL